MKKTETGDSINVTTAPGGRVLLQVVADADGMGDATLTADECRTLAAALTQVAALSWRVHYRNTTGYRP